VPDYFVACLFAQVAEVMKQAAALEAYLQQRGMVIPEGFLSYKVITPNPKFR